jgi:hypothetical protein
MKYYPQSNSFPRKTDGIGVLVVHKAVEYLNNIHVVMLNSSRKAPSLTDCHKFTVNTHVVKPVAFHRFFESSQSSDFSWAALNQRPQPAAKEKS